MMDARRIDGFLNVHLEIDDFRIVCRTVVMIRLAAGRAENQDRLAVPRHDRGVIELSGVLPGAIAFASPWTTP